MLPVGNGIFACRLEIVIMAGGLRYETGRDMPPGMQELTADKLIEKLRGAVAMAATAPVPVNIEVPMVADISNGDRIRTMSDEELVEKLFWIYRLSTEHEFGDVSKNWCDCKGGCLAECKEEVECDEEKHKACILRWLRSPAKEENYGNG